MLTEERCIIPIHVEDFCKTSLIELFTKTPEYILGHDVECGFSIHRKLAKNTLDFSIYRKIKETLFFIAENPL